MKVKSGAGATGNCCDGIVVEVSGNHLTSTCGKGDEQQFTVAKDAKITCDGKPSRLTDLEEGTTIRMTLSVDDKRLVRAIDSGAHIPELTTK